MKNILLVNPWIYDFAAYDLWMKPWGLLKISSILKANGFNVFFVDVLDRYHCSIKDSVKSASNGTGKFISEEIKKPFVYNKIPRKYKRYGLSIESFIESLPDCNIDFVFVSSGMTYWYLGVFKTIEILKKRYPKALIILGGIYATLSKQHAIKNSGADHVIDNKELLKINTIIKKDCDFSFQNILDKNIDYIWYSFVKYAVIRVSLSCPFNCSYCAQKSLSSSNFILKNKNKALDEITSLYYEKGIKIFAFYDDALLFDQKYIEEYFQECLNVGIRAQFFTPNGLHARFITKNIANLLKKMNFINPILSLEIANDKKSKIFHNKITRKELEKAVLYLKEAGYNDGEFTIYLMLGMPGSDLNDVKESIRFVYSLGGIVSLSEFSPIPKTVLGQQYKNFLEEPLLQNNSAFPFFDLLEWKGVRKIKNFAKELNNVLKERNV